MEQFINHAFSSEELTVTIEQANNNEEGENKSLPSHRIQWTNLSFDVQGKKKFSMFKKSAEKGDNLKRILHPQNGYIQSGSLTALMGPSGSGKTTLLNCITGKCDANNVGGNIDFVSKNWRRHSIIQENFKTNGNNNTIKMSYVPQADDLHLDLTVRETLNFSLKCSILSGDYILNGNSFNDVIESYCKEVYLHKALDTQVSKCSGGQVKRLAVVSAIISCPNILILDEPTTGLDSFSASILIKSLKNMITKGNRKVGDQIKVKKTAIICAIHQPSYEVFQLFDQLYVLSEGGKNIFFGPPSNVPAFLVSNNITMATNANPADYLMLACLKAPDADGDNGVKTFAIETGVEHLQKMNYSTVPIANVIRSKSGWKMLTFISFFMCILKRQLILFSYEPWPILSRSLFSVGVTLLVTSMYNHNIGSRGGCFDDFIEQININYFENDETFHNMSATINESFESITFIFDNIGFVYVNLLFLSLVHSIMPLIEIPKEMNIIRNEVYNSFYPPECMILAKFIFTLVTTTLHIFPFTILALYVTHQRITIDSYMIISSMYLFLALLNELSGFILGSLLYKHSTISVLLQLAILFPIFFCCGFLIKQQYFYFFWKPITYLSWAKHVFEGVMIAIYGQGRCVSSNIQPDDVFWNGTAINGANSNDYGNDVDTKESIAIPFLMFGMSDEHLTRSYNWLAMIMIVYIVIAIIVMRFVMTKKM